MLHQILPLKMKKYILFITFLSLNISFSQIGINIDNPDPSSILDVQSVSQGVLMPRMTTAQKLAISTPATGLTVFDTDLNSFQYYNGTNWVFLEDIHLRDNYKLVKNISDLSDELVAGGGSVYKLNTDFLYEINGTVIFDFPIDLNGAYIEGVDSTEDTLVNNFSGTLFTGTTGGSIRNITLSGSIPSGTKQPIFDLTGTSSDLLLINNVVMANASKIGTIDGFGTVFISVSQYLGNNDGYTINDVDSFFVSNIFWTETNTGTFIEFTGSFQDLQMNGGRIVLDTGEKGIDVSSNPTIGNDATLSQLSFVGAGLAVDRYTVGSYTGFNFTKDWNVNCSGIPIETDQVAAANFYFGGTLSSGYSQDITNDTPVQIKSSTNFVASGLFRFIADDNNNDVIYKGKKARKVQINVSLSIRVDGPNILLGGNANGDFYAFSIAKNGSIVTETNSVVRIDSTTQIQNVALNGVLSLEPDDKIEVFVSRLTGAGTDVLSVFSQNLSVR